MAEKLSANSTAAMESKLLYSLSDLAFSSGKLEEFPCAAPRCADVICIFSPQPVNMAGFLFFFYSKMPLCPDNNKDQAVF